MDDLEVNPVYRAFLTKFRREFDIACRLSYLIAIPHSSTLENANIDQYFVNSHILMPSKLLKMHYTPLQANSFATDIEIESRKLIIHRRQNDARHITSRISINIIAEEMGYNVNNKEYKTILIDRPLLHLEVPTLSKLSTNLPKPSNGGGLVQRLGNTKSLKNQEDCSRYIESLSQKVTVDLETEVKLMQSNYIIISKFLDDAAERISLLCESYVPKYERSIEDLMRTNSNDIACSQLQSFAETIRQAIRVSVENYTCYLLHGKLMASFHSLYETDDERIMYNCYSIHRANLNVCQLGAQSILSDFNLSDELMDELISLPTLQCPLAIISCLTRSIDMINENLNQLVKFMHSMGLLNGSSQCYSDSKTGHRPLVSICSDDLIACLVFSLARAKPVKLYSVSRYLDTFGWSSTSRDQAAYYAATFQIVVQYIYNYSGEDKQLSTKPTTAANRWMDSRAETQQQQQIRSPEPQPGETELEQSEVISEDSSIGDSRRRSFGDTNVSADSSSCIELSTRV